MTNSIGAASIGLSVDSSGVEAGMRPADAAIVRTGRNLTDLGRTGASTFDGLGTGAGAAATRVDAATRSMINSIQRTTAVADAGERGTRAFFETLANQRGISTAALRPYLDQLEQVRTRQAAAAEAARASGRAFEGNAMSAGAMSAALRGVPAQFTDIVTSLQGGQRPLSVFLQQGGQLRDMFGGAGAAARALAGYVASLVTPVTLAAAAVVGAGVAYNTATSETDAYRKALILTGNVVGLTTGQLGGMAAAISKTVGTQGEAAAVLATMASTGKIAGDNMQRFGQIALQSQKTFGIAVDDTVKTFADLGKAPLATAKKLDEQYNYLTLSVKRQIKALEDHGRFEEAGALAQSTFADAMESRNDRIKASMGLLERSWAASTSGMKTAWDTLVGVFREDTLAEQIEKAQKKLDKARAARYTFAGGGADGAADEAKAAKDLQNLKDAEERTKRIGASQVEVARAKEAGSKWDEEGIKYLSRQEQLERDIAKARNMGAATATTGTDPAATEKLVNDRILAIRKQYSDIFNAGIDSQIEAIKRRGAAEDLVATRSMTALTASRNAGTATSLQAQFSYADQEAALDIAAFNRHKALLQDELVLTAKKANSDTAQAALRGQINQTDIQIANRKIALSKEIFVLDVKNTRDVATNYAVLAEARSADLHALEQQLQTQTDANALIGKSKQEIAAHNAALVEETAVRLESQAAIIGTNELRKDEAETLRKSAAAMRALSAAQSEGVKKSVDFEETKKVWESIDRTAQTAFTDIFNGGKNTFDRLRDTLKSGLLDMLYQMTVKKWIFQIAASVTGYSGLAGAAAAAGADGAASTATGAAGGNNLIGAASSALSAYRLTTTAGASITAAGNLFGSSAVAAFGTGLSGGAATAEAAAAYAAAGETAVASGLTAGASVSAGIGAAGEAVTAVLAAIPVWGWAALAAVAVASYLGVFSGDGPEQNTKLQFTSNNTPGNISINERGNEGKSDAYIAGSASSAFGTFGVNSTLWAPAESATVQDFIKTVAQTDDALSAFLTTTEKASVTSYLTGKTTTAYTGPEGNIANAGDELSKVFAIRITNILEGIQPGLSALETSFTGTSQELATETAALLKYRQALGASGEAVFGAAVTLQQIAALKTPTEATSVALARITAEFTSTNAVAALLGKTSAEVYGAVGLASAGAREQLIGLAGGANTLASQAASFAQNYLSEADRLAPVATALDAALASLGLQGVTTRDQLKAVAMALDLTTEAGAREFAGILALGDVFAQVHPQTVELASATDIANAKRQQEIRLMGLQGDKVGALAAQREQENAALDKATLTIKNNADALSDLQDAQSALNSAASSFKSALSTAAGMYQAFIDNVTSASTKLDDARAAIVDQYRSALTASTDAAGQVQAARSQITDSYVQAAEKVRSIFSSITTNLLKFVGDLDTTALGAGSIFDQFAALQGQFTTTAAQARAGDGDAAAKLPDLAKVLLAAGEKTSTSSFDYAKLVAQVRTSVSDAATVTQAKAGGVVEQTDLQKAIVEQERWVKAVAESGSSFTAGATNLLDGYNKAVDQQAQANVALKYWTQVAAGTGTSLVETKSALQVTGDALIKGFFDAQQGLATAQIELSAASAIKADLDLKQTSTLEAFVGAIKDVNTAGKTAADAAAALFSAASNSLVAGSALSAAAMSSAKEGMAYWGSVVTSTAAGIATSMQAMIAAAAAIQVAQATSSAAAGNASTAASADETMVRSWYANNSQYQSNGTSVTQAEVDYWLRQLQAASATEVKKNFAIAAAHDAGFSTPISIDKFASGAAFTNGVATRPTSFRMGQIGEAGDEGVLPLANIGGKLGVHAAGGGNKATAAAIEALQKTVALQQAALDKMAKSTELTSNILSNVTRGGTGVVLAPAGS